jgi:murein L,D-transpeptidase YafK
MKQLRIYFALVLSVCCGIAIMAFAPNNTITEKNIPQATIAFRMIKPVADSTDNPYYIIVTKNTYELKVYDDQGWYATYPVVFGSRDLSDKMRQGDRLTPDGSFKVILKKINKDWGPELLLNYPNDSSYLKFRERKAEGLIPKTAKIGDGIAIHATRKSEEWTVDNFYNWTDGCISVKYTEMEDLYSYIPVGTPVTIVEE